MYFGRQAAGLYDPIDAKKAQYSGSLAGSDAGAEMGKLRQRVDEQDRAAAAEHARRMQDSFAQSQHERGMMQAEQQRRMYDSETARMGQQQKYSVLGGLLGGGMPGSGRLRRFGDVPASGRG